MCRVYRQECGFMLVEFLFTLSIITILTSVAAVTCKRYLERMMLDQYAGQIKADITFSQEEAIRKHSVCEIRWDRSKPAYEIYINNQLVRSRQPDSFITYKFKYFSLPNSHVVYDFFGRTSVSGQIILTNSYGDIRDLVLYMQSGQVRILSYILQTGT